MEDQSKFTSPAWERYVKAMLDREPTPEQQKCSHTYVRVPKSGQIMGNLVWRCPHCEKFVEAS